VHGSRRNLQNITKTCRNITLTNRIVPPSNQGSIAISGNRVTQAELDVFNISQQVARNPALI
jgi:hypothetical protein